MFRRGTNLYRLYLRSGIRWVLPERNIKGIHQFQFKNCRRVNNSLFRRTAKEERLEIALEKGVCFSYVSSELTGVTIITDEEYPRRVATDLMIKIIEELTAYIYQNKINLQAITKDTDIKFTYIDEIIKTWQNPSESN